MTFNDIEIGLFLRFNQLSWKEGLTLCNSLFAFYRQIFDFISFVLEVKDDIKLYQSFSFPLSVSCRWFFGNFIMKKVGESFSTNKNLLPSKVQIECKSRGKGSYLQ